MKESGKCKDCIYCPEWGDRCISLGINSRIETVGECKLPIPAWAEREICDGMYINTINKNHQPCDCDLFTPINDEDKE